MGLHSGRADLFRQFRRQFGRNIQFGAVLVDVLRLVRIELMGGPHLAQAGCFGPGVPQHRAFDLAAAYELLHQDLPVVPECFPHARFEFTGIAGLGDADGGTQVGGLDETGHPQPGPHFVEGDPVSLGGYEGHELGYDDARIPQQALHHVLVHGHRRSKDA